MSVDWPRGSPMSKATAVNPVEARAGRMCRTVIQFVIAWRASEAKCSEASTPRIATQSAARCWDHTEWHARQLDAWVTPTGLALLQQPSFWRHSAAAHQKYRKTARGKGSEVVAIKVGPPTLLLQFVLAQTKPTAPSATQYLRQ